MAHRTVRQIQFFCRTRKAAVTGSRFKCTQRLEGREVFEHDVKFYSQCARKGFVGFTTPFRRQSIPKQFTRV